MKTADGTTPHMIGLEDSCMCCLAQWVLGVCAREPDCRGWKPSSTAYQLTRWSKVLRPSVFHLSRDIYITEIS